eukprot:tig00000204_g17715.t2
MRRWVFLALAGALSLLAFVTLRARMSSPAPLQVVDEGSSPSMLAAAGASAFLGELPLKILSITPHTGSAMKHDDKTPVPISQRSAITVVFNRAVIALGSDFDKEGSAKERVPFTLHTDAGVEVPGKLRWVTTYIARFDPDVDWPTDLTLEVRVNLQLKTYGGVALSNPAYRTFVTPALEWSLGTVTSEKARNATGGWWDPFLAGPDPENRVPEVPEDGRVTLSFTHAVDAKLLARILTLTGPRGEAVPFTVEACPPGAAAGGPFPVPAFRGGFYGGYQPPAPAGGCAVVVPSAPLALDGAYKLALPAGSRVHPLAGPTKRDLELKLSGPTSFSFPFVAVPGHPDTGLRPSFRRYHLWLKHGLAAAPGTPAERAALDALAAAITVIPGVPIKVTRVGLARIQIEGPFDPSVWYKIHVGASAAVRDAFGNPLVASETAFQSADGPSSFLQAQGYALFDADFGGRWHVLAIGTNLRVGEQQYGAQQVPRVPFAVAGAAVGPVEGPDFSALALALRDRHGDREPLLPESSRVEAPLTPALSLARASDADGGAEGLDAAALLAPSGLFARHSYTGVGWDCSGGPCGPYVQRQTEFAAVSSVAVSLVASASDLTAWVTRLSDASSVAGATVLLYGFNWQDRSVKELGRATTGPDGTAALPLVAPGSYELSAFVVHEGRVLYHPQVPTVYGGYDDGKPHGTILTDRAMYKEGDVVHVKGYLRQNGGKSGLQVYDPSNLDHWIEVRWSDQRPSAERVPVKIDPEHGSFDAQLTVPGDVSYGMRGITLMSAPPAKGSHDVEAVGSSPKKVAPEHKGFAASPRYVPGVDSFKIAPDHDPAMYGAYHIAYASITIADPRVPTVTLKFEAEHKLVRPGPSASFPVTVTCRTYVGTAVAGASVAIKWHVGGGGGVRPMPVPGRYLKGPAFDAGGGGGGVGGETVGARLPADWVGVPEAFPPPPEPAPESSGELTATTGADGRATVDVHLAAPALKRALEAGDRVELSAVWVGPTREELKESATVRVAPSEWEVAMTPAYSPPLPGRPVMWLVAVRTVLDGASVDGAKVSLKLYPWRAAPGAAVPPPDAEGRLVLPGVTDQAPADECEAVSDGGRDFQCPIALPSVGRFLLVAEARDPAGRAAVTAVPLGSTAEEWRKRPLRSLGSLASVLDKAEYARGETARLRFASAHLPAGSRALVRWGSKARRSAQVDLPAAAAGEVEVPIEVGDECSGQCPVTVAIITPRGAPGAAAFPPDLAVSPLLDPAAPRLILLQTALTVKEARRSLQLSVAPAKETLAPGAKASLKVSLKDADGRPAAGEISIWAVEQALLDLMPHPLARLNETFRGPDAPWDQVGDSRQLLATASAYNLTVEVARRRMAKDPWLLPGAWPLRAEGGGMFHYGPGSDVDVPDEEVLAGAKSEITRFPWGAGPVFAQPYAMRAMAKGAMMESAVAMDMAAPMMAAAPPPGAAMVNAVGFGAPAGGAGGAGGPSGLAVSVPVRSAFQAVPLSKRALAVPASGEVTVEFDMPDNAGTFAIRAYASAGRAAPDAFGQAEASLVARRPLSLQPSVPRIVRLGDAFECGVTATAADPAFAGSVEVGAELAAGAPLALQGEARRSAGLSGAAPREVRFAFSAAKLGEAKVTFAARDSAGEEDALEARIPVEPLSEALFVASSVAIQATAGGAPWDEGVELPPALPGSGTVSLDASVGREAAVEAMARLVLDARDADVNGETTLATIAARAAMAAYASPSSSVPPPEIAVAVEQAYAGALSALESHSDPGRGLRRYARDTNSNWVDTHLNSLALFVADRLAGHGFNLPGHLRDWYTDALGREMQRQAQEARNHGYSFSNWEGLALARLALSPAWQAGYDELSWDSLLANIDRCSMGGKAAAALAAILHSDAGRAKGAPAVKPSDERIAAILEFIAANLRVQGRTAYVAEASGSARPAGGQANAFALVALLRGGHAAHPLVEKLANSVARGSPAGAVAYCGPSPLQVAVGALAIADYDAVRGSTAADLALSVASGAHSLMEEKFAGPRAAPRHAEARWEALDDPPAPLLFTATGKGEVSVAAGLRFVPAKLYSYPLYRGLYVERSVRRVDAATLEPRGRPVGAAALAETLLVTLQITTPDELSGVEVVDLLPGGLEAVDPNVDPAGRTDALWGSPFYHRQVKKDRVTMHARQLPPGTHSVSYQVRAVTAGTFALPSTRAYAVEQPELMGLAPAGSFSVRDGKVTDDEAAAAATYAVSDPKACPNGCSARGACNVRTGTCECSAGFAGADCSTEASSRRLLASEGSAQGRAPGEVPSAPAAAPSPLLAAVPLVALGVLLLALPRGRWF